jgi:hypothetical protein
MPIASSDILVKFSVAAAAGNTTAGTPAGSLGDQISTTQLTDNSLHNLFDAVGGDENAASEAEYRCIFLHNAHATLTFTNVKVFLSSETAGGASIAIGVDPTAASAIGAGVAQALTIANEDTAPVGVAFSAPTTIGAAIVIGDLAPGQCRAIWVRRTAANTAALAGDGVVLRVQGESL